MSDAYVGEIRLFAGTYAPNKWAFCAGQQVKIEDNETLYALIGTTYGGSGDYFNLPDLRGRVAVGYGQGTGLSNRILGSSSGYEKVPLTYQNLPPHTHAVTVTQEFSVGMFACTKEGELATPAAGSFLCSGREKEARKDANNYVSNPASTVNIKGGAAVANVNLASAGGSVSHENMQPWIAINYIICTDGYYPPRQ